MFFTSRSTLTTGVATCTIGMRAISKQRQTSLHLPSKKWRKGKTQGSLPKDRWWRWRIQRAKTRLPLQSGRWKRKKERGKTSLKIWWRTIGEMSGAARRSLQKGRRKKERDKTSLKIRKGSIGEMSRAARRSLPNERWKKERGKASQPWQEGRWRNGTGKTSLKMYDIRLDLRDVHHGQCSSDAFWAKKNKNHNNCKNNEKNRKRALLQVFGLKTEGVFEPCFDKTRLELKTGWVKFFLPLMIIHIRLALACTCVDGETLSFRRCCGIVTFWKPLLVLCWRALALVGAVGARLCFSFTPVPHVNSFHCSLHFPALQLHEKNQPWNDTLPAGHSPWRWVSCPLVDFPMFSCCFCTSFRFECCYRPQQWNHCAYLLLSCLVSFVNHWL